MNASPRLKLALYFLLVLATGILFGAAGALRFAKRAAEHRQNPSHWAADTMERFDSRLHLTPAQESRLAPVFSRMAADLQAVRQRAWTDWLDVLRAVEQETRPILTPEQIVTFDRMVEEYRERLADASRIRPGN